MGGAMRIFKGRWRALSLAVLASAIGTLSVPVRAGDDECMYTMIGPWEVAYDRLCERAIHRRLESISVSLMFDQPSQGPSLLRISGASSATSVGIKIGRKSVGTATKSGGFQFSAPSAGQVFAALRKKRNVVITLSDSSGSAKTLTLDGTNFEAAYQRLLQ